VGSPKKKQNDTIDCGGASAQLQVDGDGIGTAVYSGLLTPSNFLALSVLVIRAGVARQARGLLYCIDQAIICFTPDSLPEAYSALAEQLKALPVAFVTNEAQAELHRLMVQRAGEHGLVRRQFSDAQQARQWLVGVTQALSDNRGWWQKRERPPPH
jgi:hypothetical protein